MRRTLASLVVALSIVVLASPACAPSADGAIISTITPPKPTVEMEQVRCIAEVIYHEARSEGRMAQEAVAFVILTRAKASGTSPCDVVRQPRQFHGAGLPMLEDRARTESQLIAFQVVSGDITPPFDAEATHFHDISETPWWTTKMQRIGAVGKMVFWAEPRMQQLAVAREARNA